MEKVVVRFYLFPALGSMAIKTLTAAFRQAGGKAFQNIRLPDSIERGMIMSRRNEKYELKISSH